MQIRIRLTREDNAQRHGVSVGSVIALDVETYLKGVLPAEIYESRTPREAKKAQAIAARTYAYRAALDGGTLSDTPASQSYRAALADTSPLCCEAVDDTRAQVLTYCGEIIRCYYSRSNGGQTKRTDQVWAAKLPYYKARADPWDKAACAEAAAQGKTIKASHGVGLSQVGAEYAARLGENAADILAFYYPYTEIIYCEDVNHMAEKSMTGKQLAEFAIRCHQVGVRYWYGTCYYKCTESLLASKKKQYPSAYTDARMAEYRADIAAGAYCCDCVGLIKGAAWTGLGDHDAKYGTGGCPDKSADGLLAYCKNCGMASGSMDTFPDIPGLLLHKSGHVGVSIGGGEAVEAQGFATDVVRRAVSGRGWTSWAKLPFVDYGDSADASELPEEENLTLGCRTLRRGCKGDDVAELQDALVALGYDCGSYGTNRNGVDGSYGRTTEAAVRTFQADAGITIDGIFGKNSLAALLAMQLAGGPAEPGEDGSPEESETPPTFRVMLPMLTKEQADEVRRLFPEAVTSSVTLTLYGVDSSTTTSLLEQYKWATAVEEND